MTTRKKRPPTGSPQGVMHALFLFLWWLGPIGRVAALLVIVPFITALGIWLILPDQTKLAALSNLMAAPGQLRALVTPVSRPFVIDIARLCGIERHLIEAVKSADEPSHIRDLAGHYRHANPTLADHLDDIVRTFRSSERHVGTTYLMGPPGVGKSFVLRGVTGATNALDLRKLFLANRSRLGLVERDDLVTLNARRRFNALLTIPDGERFTLDTLLSLAPPDRRGPEGRMLVLIDDLDEIHPESSRLVLGAVDQYVRTARHLPFLHIVVAGRPEAFADTLTDPRRSGPGDAQSFHLRPPVYVSDRALERVAHSVFQYKHKRPADGATVEAFVRLVRGHPFLTYSIGTLAIAEFAVEHAALNDPRQTTLSLQSAIYDNLLERNNKTHNRPLANAREYQSILEDVAANYVDAVDDRGGFVVGFTDEVPLGSEAPPRDAVRVRDVLDRSGIALLDPAEFKTRRYAFHPFWVHAYLVERRNARLHPAHAPRTCEGTGRAGG